MFSSIPRGPTIFRRSGLSAPGLSGDHGPLPSHGAVAGCRRDPFLGWGELVEGG